VRPPGNASSRNAYVQDTGEVEEYPLSIGCSDPPPSRTRTTRARSIKLRTRYQRYQDETPPAI